VAMRPRSELHFKMRSPQLACLVAFEARNPAGELVEVPVRHRVFVVVPVVGREDLPTQTSAAEVFVPARGLLIKDLDWAVGHVVLRLSSKSEGNRVLRRSWLPVPTLSGHHCLGSWSSF
jgi:hypothetical protein